MAQLSAEASAALLLSQMALVLKDRVALGQGVREHGRSDESTGVPEEVVVGVEQVGPKIHLLLGQNGRRRKAQNGRLGVDRNGNGGLLLILLQGAWWCRSPLVLDRTAAASFRLALVLLFLGWGALLLLLLRLLLLLGNDAALVQKRRRRSLATRQSFRLGC
jgi:hypothetical protein